MSPRRRWFYALVPALAALTALAAGEVAVRLRLPANRLLTDSEYNEYVFRVRHGEIDDPVARPQIQARMQLGLAAAGAAQPVDDASPELGWVPHPGYRSDGTNTNQDGLRGLEEVVRARTPGRKRIVAIGDSFTWGEGVRDDETYCRRLAALVPGTEVLNLGVHGYGTDQQLILLEQKGLAYSPDLVVLGFFTGDASRNLETFTDYAKPRFVLEDGRLVLANVPVPSPEQLVSKLPAWWVPRLPRAVSHAWGRDARRVEAAHVTLSIFDAILARCHERGARLLVLVIDANAPRSFLGPGQEELAALEWAHLAGVPLVDMRARLLELPPEERAKMWLADGHWSPAGHALCARILQEELVLLGF